MRIVRFCFSCIAVVLDLAAASQVTCPPGWSKYLPPEGDFMLCYPQDWHWTTPEQTGRLDIINFPVDRRLHGAVVPEGGANIVLVQLAQRDGTTAAAPRPLIAWLTRDLGGIKPDAVKKSRVANPAVQGEALTGLWTWPAGPMAAEGSKLRERAVYFQTRAGTFRLSVIYWMADKSEREYDQLLQGILRTFSLRE